ncbi:MAG TPA: succinylglutamate desuccinylase/aspartoacylase family protein [Candidatus Saccharimonadales bacterium]|nr:succinylglutamate desuccinylase/aspartoacylase family protein [Candidatus Saccharimonadales bacterium]
MSTPLHEINEPAVYSLEDFAHGRPEAIMQASPDVEQRIFMMWPHGNELLGPSVGHHMYTQRPDLLERVDYMCGNPLAAEQEPQRRYTEGITPGYTKEGTDLNRSFSPDIDPQSYEEARARKISEIITNGNYGYVLDVHTSTTDFGSCFLIGEQYREEPAVREIIAASPISNIVVMPENIPYGDKQVPLVTTGLIGNFANSVSIEYNRDLAAKVGVEETIKTIDGLIAGQSLYGRRKRHFFNVDDFMWKTQDPGPDAKNFELCEYGYYPVLYGENTYRKDPTKPYLGFAASTRDIEIL